MMDQDVIWITLLDEVMVVLSEGFHTYVSGLHINI